MLKKLSALLIIQCRNTYISGTSTSSIDEKPMKAVTDPASSSSNKSWSTISIAFHGTSTSSNEEKQRISSLPAPGESALPENQLKDVASSSNAIPPSGWLGPLVRVFYGTSTSSNEEKQRISSLPAPGESALPETDVASSSNAIPPSGWLGPLEEDNSNTGSPEVYKNALNALVYAEASYKQDSASALEHIVEHGGVSNIATPYYNEKIHPEINCIISYEKKTKIVYIGIRGSKDPMDWISNLAAVPLYVDQSGAYKGAALGDAKDLIQFHAGFLYAAVSMIQSDAFMDALSSIIGQTEDWSIVLAGHSRGGALATLIGLFLSNREFTKTLLNSLWTTYLNDTSLRRRKMTNDLESVNSEYFMKDPKLCNDLSKLSELKEIKVFSFGSPPAVSSLEGLSLFVPEVNNIVKDNDPVWKLSTGNFVENYNKFVPTPVSWLGKGFVLDNLGPDFIELMDRLQGVLPLQLVGKIINLTQGANEGYWILRCSKMFIDCKKNHSITSYREALEKFAENI